MFDVKFDAWVHRPWGLEKESVVTAADYDAAQEEIVRLRGEIAALREFTRKKTAHGDGFFEVRA